MPELFEVLPPISDVRKRNAVFLVLGRTSLDFGPNRTHVVGQVLQADGSGLADFDPGSYGCRISVTR